MADNGSLFDDEPEKPQEPASAPAQGQPGQEGGAPRGAVSRRRFLVGAGVAAAGTAGTVGIGSLGGGKKSSGGATNAQPAKGTNGTSAGAAGGAAAQGVTVGLPAGQTISQALVRLNVNGADHWLSVAPHETLAEVLRQNLGLTGTKIGCDRSECSACTVIVDGVPQNSCSLLAIREDGRKITTVEGLEQGTTLSAVQQAFMEHMGLQCGFCTPGQIMQATALLQTNKSPDEAAIRRAMSGNLCKCAAYPNILAAVAQAAKASAG